MGFRAGQFLSIRLFFSPPKPTIWSTFRAFESHPFSIATAPATNSILNDPNLIKESLGVELFIKSCGTGSWTGDLEATAQLATQLDDLEPGFDEEGSRIKKKLYLWALVEGPYGGLGPFVTFEQENILLVAGGSGMSFILGILDELVARKLRTGGRISVVWAIKERGESLRL